MLTRRLMIVASLGILANAQAATPVNLLVWYPGAGGTAAAAAPLMTQWADYLTQQTPDLTWTITFAGTEADGKAALAKRPTLVMASHAMRVRAKIGGATLASSVPAALGATTEQWFAVHPANCAPTMQFSTEPIDTALRAQLFPTHTGAAPTPTNNLLGLLRRAAAGECLGLYVSQREWQNTQKAFKTLTTTLTAEASAISVPTPQIVQQATTLNATQTAAISTSLRTMHKNPAGKAILQELQLARFE